MIFALPVAAEERSGVQIFIEACKNYGNNPTLIRSMYVEAEEIESERPLSDVQFALEVKKQTETLRNNYQGTKQELDERIAEIADNIKSTNAKKRTQHKLLLRCDDTVHHLSHASTREWNFTNAAESTSKISFETSIGRDLRCWMSPTPGSKPVAPVRTSRRSTAFSTKRCPDRIWSNLSQNRPWVEIPVKHSSGL